jgi:hypothetical protein
VYVLASIVGWVVAVEVGEVGDGKLELDSN